uniref:Uncharacterized protein n=1 Tax=Astyanax mexicanus TaxID=7994 RepID=A0A8B9HRL8_ASTMX
MSSILQVSILGNSDPEVHEIAYQYGKNVGIAFQLVDDVLDFTSCANHLGKPSAADLKLGLATGPVLFACQQVWQQYTHTLSHLETSVNMRSRLLYYGDVDRAWQYVLEVGATTITFIIYEVD